jgi:hypothetical protein
MLPNGRAGFGIDDARIVATGGETVDAPSLGAGFALDTADQKPKFHAANRAPDACADQRVNFHKTTLRRFT